MRNEPDHAFRDRLLQLSAPTNRPTADTPLVDIAASAALRRMTLKANRRGGFDAVPSPSPSTISRIRSAIVRP